jgi:flagellar biosynthesis protein FlhF
MARPIMRRAYPDGNTMRIKKYTASSMKEALLQIKQDLGDDAMILKTRKLPHKMFAMGTREEIEVTAAIDDAAAAKPQPLRPLSITDPGVYARPRSVERAAGAKPQPAGPAYAPRGATEAAVAAPTTPMDRLGLLEIKGDIRAIKDFLKSIRQPGEMTSAAGFSGPWAALYKRMIDAEIQPALAERLIMEIKGETSLPDTDIEKRFVDVLSRRFPVSGPLRGNLDGPVVVAFVGPTGAGKTTTLAKLAAHYALNKESTVSLISADTYRIAAIEQIRSFADIVNVGLQVIFSADEVAAALSACKNDDFVFIDTAGRSPQDREHMQELDGLMKAFAPDEIHLVLSASTKESDLVHTVNHYREHGVNRLLFTKLDETVRLGNVFDVVQSSGIAVSYLTFGQSVPDDIELAQPGRFIQRLWEGSV